MNKKYTVGGMTCSACSARVERCVGKIEGVRSVTVNLISGVMSVSAERDLTEEIKKAVTAEGYTVKEGASMRRSGEQARRLKIRLLISLPLVILLMYVAMGHMFHMDYGWAVVPPFLHDAKILALVEFLLATPVLIVNYRYFTSGFRKLFSLAPNMDSLIALGSSVSYIYSIYATAMIFVGYPDFVGSLFYEGAAMILAFITIGKFLEEKSKNKTMSAVEKLLDLAPDTAVVVRDGKEVEINSAELKVGDTVVLKDGFTAPCDGVITEGNGWADESVITGESIPVYKEKGGKIICGSKFGGGYCLFKAESVGEDSTVFKIVKLVEDANSTKVPIARIADKIAGVFVPAVIAIAAAALTVWLIAGAAAGFAVNIAVSVLVVSCPCALGLATPAALMAGTGKAAENGILVKSGEALQNLAAVNAVVLDKTGTITYGKPEVVDHAFSEVFGETEFLKIAAAVERRSSHVLGKPIIALAEEKGISDAEVSDFAAVAGSGVKATVGGKVCLIGNGKLMRDCGIELKNYSDGFGEECTVLHVAYGGEHVGSFAIKDRIKPTSVAATEEFGRLGVKAVMLTGDGEKAAKAVAEELGIEYKAGVLPEDKHTEVGKLKENGLKVMMVGDGVNDAPALAEADVGAAIGAGTDVAIESADVVLIKNELTDAAEAVRLGRKVMLNIKENLFWAFFYNIILIPVACGVFYPAFGLKMNPMFASAAMSLSSIFVVTNALRLRFFRFGEKNKKSGAVGNAPKTEIKVGGMTCAHCKKRVEDALFGIGIKATVDLKKKVAETDAKELNEEKIREVLSKAGYKYKGVKKNRCKV